MALSYRLIKKNIPDDAEIKKFLESLDKLTFFLDKGLKGLQFTAEEVSFKCPCCKKPIKIKI